jgi:tetratricopeptide (TPR) repeat protein
MPLLGFFRRKGKEKETTETKKETKEKPKPEAKTLLDELCKNDKELCEALNRALLLNPETATKEGIESHVQKAEEYEKDQRITNARIEYQAAGQVALHDGKLPQMQKYFKKAAEIEPDSPYKKTFEYLSKKENAEKAITIAQEFYTKARQVSKISE